MEDLDSFEAIGRTLRHVREQRGWSEEEVATHLRLRLPYVQYLEMGDIGRLPGVIYARGYLQRYATLLELNEATLLNAFDTVANYPHRRSFHLPEVLSRDAPPAPQLVITTFALGFLILLASAIAHFNAFPKRSYVLPLPVEKPAEAEPPAEAIEEPAEVTEATEPTENTEATGTPTGCQGADVYPPCYWAEIPVKSHELLTIENTELKTE